MTIGAAVCITSDGEERTITHASAFARRHRVPCFVFSVVDRLPYGDGADLERDVVQRNLKVIAEQRTTHVVQEGDDIAGTLLVLATGFGVTTLFLRIGSSPKSGRPIAEQLLYLNPPFDIVVVGSE
jgi:hypothetical protein